MIVIKEYLDEKGISPFAEWFDDIEARAASKVTMALLRMEQGNFSNAKRIGAGVYEYHIDYGPGYRLYFAKDSEKLIILLCGGTKKRQQRDIAKAKSCWKDYKKRKK